jgi:hypothetical protein
MSATNNAATYIGRIGGLAVALGVGAAIASGTGIAYADTTSTSSDSSSSSDSSGSTETRKDRRSEASTYKSGERATKRESTNDTTSDKDESDDHDSGESGSPDPEPNKDDDSDTGASDGTTTKSKSAPKSTYSTKRADREDTDQGPNETAPNETASNETASNETAGAVTDTSVDRELAATDTRVRTSAYTQAQAEAATVRPRLVTRLLSAFGVDSAAKPGPATPAQSPALAALLGWVRRESERSYTSSGQASTAAATYAAAAVVDPLPSSLASSPVGWVTGDRDINCRLLRCVTGNQTNDTVNPPPWPNTNSAMGIYGTDLGIMWDGGVWNGKRFVHVAFGDTFSGPGMTGDWRSNGLVISTDNTLGNGLSLEQTGYVGQFIAGRRALGLFGSEVTVIPTAGIRILDRQYVNYMSVKSWDTPGRWTTNFSAISRYNPSNDQWELVSSTIRSAGWLRSSTPYRPGDQNFQQMAYVLQPEDQVAEGDPRYLYAFGTPSGRAGSAYLSRVAEGDVTDLSRYEYWDGNNWVAGNAAVAKPVIGTDRSSGLFGFVVDWANDPNVLGGYLGGLFGAKTGGNVSEMSVQYNEYLDKYVVLYGDGNNNIQMRVADTPESAWSDPIQLASSAQYPGLYAPMIHPWSGTGELENANGSADYSTLYWNMSLWDPYNVVLMETDLSPLQTVQV